jgi:glutaredoxin-like protein
MLLGEKEREAIGARLHSLTGKVRLLFFESALDCPYCPQTKELLRELAGLSPLLDIQVFNFHTDAEAVRRFGVARVPALVLLDEQEKDYGIRFYGIPAGFEFSTLLEDILMISTGRTNLAESSVNQLKALGDRVHLQVFITPGCPYCPAAVRLAHMSAYVSEQVTADMVEATEFPDLSAHYQVYGVPKTVANESNHWDGAVPEAQFIQSIVDTAAQSA